MPKSDAGNRGRAVPNVATGTVFKGLTLREALLFFGDAEQIAEMLHLEATGYSGPQLIVLETPLSESARKQLRYDRLRRNAEISLRTKLIAGEIIATGRDPRDRLDDPRKRVPPELWQTLAFDFANSTASGDGLLITHILIPEQGSLHLWKVARRARLGKVELELTPQSHSLLLALAEQALESTAPVESRKLEARFFSNRTDQKALGQAMGTLRKQLVKSGLDKKMVALLIRPVRGVGYALGMPATEITIEP
jgi:hypothetical protein